MRRLVRGAVVTIALRASEARAEVPAAWSGRPFAIGVVGSLGSPVGVLGVTFDTAVTPYLVLQAGLGISPSYRPWRYAGSLRYRFFLPSGAALSVGAGVSGGYIIHHEDHGDAFIQAYRALEGVWIDGFTSLEWNHSASIRMALSAGVEVLTGQEHSRCYSMPTGGSAYQRVSCGAGEDAFQKIASWLPFLSFTVSHPFGG